MGIGSLFGLSRLLAEAVRIELFDGLGKKGKPAKVVARLLRWLGSLRRSCPTLRAKRRQRCWGRGFLWRYMAQSACQVGRFGFRRAERRAERRAKVDLTTQYSNK